jgi:hypothetical protein
VSVNAIWMLVLGGIFCVSSVLVGRYLASLTPQRAARFKTGDRPGALKEFHLMGKIMMVGGPLFLLLFTYMALTGMAEG